MPIHLNPPLQHIGRYPRLIKYVCEIDDWHTMSKIFLAFAYAIFKRKHFTYGFNLPLARHFAKRCVLVELRSGFGRRTELAILADATSEEILEHPRLDSAIFFHHRLTLLNHLVTSRQNLRDMPLLVSIRIIDYLDFLYSIGPNMID